MILGSGAGMKITRSVEHQTLCCGERRRRAVGIRNCDLHCVECLDDSSREGISSESADCVDVVSDGCGDMSIVTGRDLCPGVQLECTDRSADVERCSFDRIRRAKVEAADHVDVVSDDRR